MSNRKILFICGSLNQTTMIHKIARYFPGEECYFTPYYSDGFIKYFTKTSLLDFSILGGQFRKRTLDYLKKQNLKVDFEGAGNNYDLVYTCSDLIIPRNILDKKVILVQEGMTDPENFMYYLVKNLKLPRWLASTSVTGLSDSYSKFCVASEGYRKLFIRKGVNPAKIEVTGIPNFDNCAEFLQNDFPYKNYILVATSDARETYKYENRKKFIEYAKSIANGRQLIFKLHPNENIKRATEEINKYAPGALIFHLGNTSHMIANCDILITRYSSVVYVGLALGKEVYSDFDIEELRELTPIQNNGSSAKAIAEIGTRLMMSPVTVKDEPELRRTGIKKKMRLKFRSKLINAEK